MPPISVVTSSNLGTWLTLDLVDSKIKVLPSTDAGNRIVLGSDNRMFCAKTTTAQHRWMWHDYYLSGIASHVPFNTVAISAGTTNSAIAALHVGHYGIIDCRSSATANSGISSSTNVTQNSFVNQAGLLYRSVFSTPAVLTNVTIYSGFHDTATNALPVDGAYLKVINGVATFETANNSVRTSGTPTATLTASTWYTVDIEFLTTASARCVVFTDALAKVLDVTITTNLPTAGTRARNFFAGIVGTCSAAAATPLFLLDYQGVGPARPEFIITPA